MSNYFLAAVAVAFAAVAARWLHQLRSSSVRGGSDGADGMEFRSASHHGDFAASEGARNQTAHEEARRRLQEDDATPAEGIR